MSTIKLRRSSVAGRIPTTAQLELGEIAINTTDGKLYFKKYDAVANTESIVDVSADLDAAAILSLLSGVDGANSGLDADLLDGQEGSYYLDWDNFTNTATGVTANTYGSSTAIPVITVDTEKLQVGCSVKQLSPDPFEHIENYELNKIYKVKVVKLMDFGAFCELEPGLTTLLHSSELSWTKKNISAKKMFKVGDEIECIITEIDKDKRRVAISHRLTQDNPFETFETKYPVGTIVEGEVVNKNEYSLFVKVEDLDVDAFLHCNDLTYLNNGEDELEKYKKGDKIKVKVLEVKASEQKIRVGLRQTQADPFDYFNDKKKNQTITVKVISTDNKGLTVRPENCEMDFQIKKSEIAINAADARPSRWTGGEKVDVAIKEIQLDKRKVVLSIKLLEEIEKKEALDKYGSEGSGKNLPFSSLSDDLKKKEEDKE